jgi:hypothetical protein
MLLVTFTAIFDPIFLAAVLTGSVTYCVLRVKAAEVIEDGRLSPLMISCHCFLLMTSTRPPRAVTRLYNS